MVRSFTSRSEEFNRLNLQLYYIEELASLITAIGKDLGEAGQNSISCYRDGIGKLYTFKDLLIGAKLSFHPRDIELFKIYMTLAEKLECYDLREGTKNLRNAYELLIKVTKVNNLIFPKKNRGFGFKSFVEDEIK
jgi:hypothetical protein